MSEAPRPPSPTPPNSAPAKPSEPGSATQPLPPSSRRRFEDYLVRRQVSLKEGRIADPWRGIDQPKRKLKRSFLSLFREFWGLLRGQRHIVIAAVGTVTLSTLIGLLPPASTKVILDYILAATPGPEGLPGWVPESLRHNDNATRFRLLIWVSAGLMVLTMLSIGIGIWGRWRMTRLTKLLQASVRHRVFDHAVRLPLHRVHQIKSGGVASILREDAGGAAELLFSLLYNPWRAIIQLIGTIVILAFTDWRLLLGSLIIIPLTYLSQKTWISRIRPVFSDIRATRQGIDAHAAEAFSGMRVVRAFGRQRGELSRFALGNHLMSRQEMLAWWWSRIIEILWLVLLPAASCAVMLYGGYRVIGHTLTLGDLMMFSFYLLLLLGPLESLTNSATGIQNQLAGFDRVLDLLGEPLELSGAGVTSDAKPGGGTLVELRRDRVQGRITLDHLHFTYPGSTAEVLTDINLDVPAGSTVALVGRSGAGKTTLCNLVARFEDPTRGRVLIDGIDLRDVDPASYRRMLGIVEQDVFLFDGTIRENIAYARRDASPAAILSAASAAGADEFIDRFERGYDTVIGERGVRLSGGQRQRLAIARAILADPRVLILDEATSNLDTESERLIQRSFATLLKGRTCFVIAHRLSTVRHADLIVVMAAGQIVETGTHDELLARGGKYAGMLAMQMSQPDAVIAGE